MATTNARTRASDKSTKWVRTRIRMKRYNIGDLISRGAFSRVYVANTTKFLLGEDSRERSFEQVNCLLQPERESFGDSKDSTLRITDTEIPIPDTVAIKVMKVRVNSRATSVPNHQPLGSAFTRRKRSLVKLTGKDDVRASILVENNMSGSSLKKFRERKLRKKVQTRRMDDILFEINCLKKVRACKYCVYLHDVVYLNLEVWLVMDYEELGDVSTFFTSIFKNKDKSQLPNRLELIRWIISPILIALEYLHNRGMIHRDVKGGNILITRCGIPKLCDFGLVQEFQELPVETRESFAGTPIYVPPEVYINEKLVRNRPSLTPNFFQSSLFSHSGSASESEHLQRIDTSFDTWSIAITMLVLYYGTSPWEYTPKVYGKNGKQVKFRKIKFPDNQLTRYLGSQLENEVRLYGYLRLHKRLYLLEKDEIEQNDKLRMPRTIPTKYMKPFRKEKKEFVEFIKTCLKLREERPTVSELMNDTYICQYVADWKRFDSKKEGNLMNIALTGEVKASNEDKKTNFQKITEQIGLLAFNISSK